MRFARTSLPHTGDGVAVPFAAIVLAMLPAVLDQTILATALPTVAADLGTLSDVSWVVTAYVVAAAALSPLWYFRSGSSIRQGSPWIEIQV